MKPKVPFATLISPEPPSVVFVNCDTDRKRSCEFAKCGKREYTSRTDAETSIREMVKKGARDPESLQAYPCRYGRHWHIGNWRFQPSDGSTRIVDGR